MTSTDQIESIVISALSAELGDRKISPGSRFREDLDADSLDIVALLIAVEERFGLRITDEEAAGLATVADAVGFISRNESRDIETR